MGGQPNPNQPRSAIAGISVAGSNAPSGTGLPGEERAELVAEALADRAQVEGGQRRVRLDQDVGRPTPAAGGNVASRMTSACTRRNSQGASCSSKYPIAASVWCAPSCTRRAARGDELHSDLRLQRPVGPAARVRGGGAVQQLTARADVDLAGGDALLHRAEAADQPAELAAALGVLDGHLVRALGRRQRAGSEAEPEQGGVLRGAGSR